MDFLLDIFMNEDGDVSIFLAVLVFLAMTSLAFVVMVVVRTRGAVKRRAAGMAVSSGTDRGSPGSLANSSMKAVHKLIENTTKHYSSLDGKNMKMLRRRLVQAGIFDPRAVGFFFLLRAVLAVGIGLAISVLMPTFTTKLQALFWPMIGLGGLFGYLAPSLVLDRKISRRRREYRSGFPDFMDLLVVCADAGLGLEASMERVGRELGPSYPALSSNIHMTNLEVRAGRTLSEALEHFGDRLGLDEVRSFATLIQQSDELGSSITDALRVYSEDMRHKRLSTAEEKAYALPAKLSIPLMVCVFPVLFVVILLPVFVRIKMGAY